MSEQDIVRVTRRINEVVGLTSLQLALEIGRVVIEELYAGDLRIWRERGSKEHTLRRLAAHPNLQMSASSLYRSIAIYELKRRLHNQPIWDVLSVCHVRAVLGLPEGEQRRLLSLAARDEWSTAALEEAAGKVRKQFKTSRGGRPRKPRFARSIEHAEKAFADEDSAFGDLDALESMSADQRDDLERRLSFVRRRCDELASLLRD